MIKIFSGWSNPGGSTYHHIALTNLLNEHDIDAAFYGPQEWHLNKCYSFPADQFSASEEDVLILHFVDPSILDHEAVNPRKVIWSCHETNLFPLKNYDLSKVDVVQFVSESQKEWHGDIQKESVVIPPVVEKVNWKLPKKPVAGIIGSIDSHKRPHLAIEEAMCQGFKRIKLFGNVTELEYFNKEINPYISKGIVTMMGHEDDREAMYNQLSKVFLASKRETFGMVKAECEVSEIPFWSLPEARSDGEVIGREEILEKWKEISLL